MKSITKYPATKAELDQIVERAGLNGVTRIEEIADGWYNSVFAAYVGDVPTYVIKIAPTKDVVVLSHEKDLMAAEVKFISLFQQKTKVKTPKVLLEDFSHTVIPTDYFVMEYLQGERLDKVNLSPSEKEQVNKAWAEVFYQMHQVAGEGFGYLQTGLKNNFADGLAHMTNLLIDDAKRLGKKNRVGQKLLSYITAFQDELTDVPCTLVNFDLHEKNIFCSKKDGKIELSILDLERCFFGDPIGDFCVVDSMRGLTDKKVFLAYQALSGMGAGRQEQIRFALHTAYLATIMYTERFSRFRSFQKYFDPIYIGGTVGYKFLSKTAFSALKKLKNHG